MAQVSEITVLDAAGQAKDVATLTAIAALIGEVQANPTENTLLDRLKDIVSAVAAIPAAGDASAANQATIISALTAIAGFVDGLEGKDYATQATLAAVLAKITAAAATEAKQDAIIGHVDGIETLITALNALITTQNGYLDTVESLIGTTNTTLTTIDGRVDTLEAAIGPTSEAAASADTGTFGLNALIKRQLAKMTSAMVTQLGARTVAQSPAVNIATDQAAIPVSGNTTYIDVALSLDTSQYAIGDVIADTQVVSNAMRVNDGTGVLQSVTVIDQDDQKAAFYIYLLSANVAMGTENAAPSISDTNALQILGPPIAIAVADYFDLGGVSVAGKDGIAKIVKPATGTRDLYVAVVNGSGTPTYTASGVRLRLGFLLD